MIRKLVQQEEFPHHSFFHIVSFVNDQVPAMVSYHLIGPMIKCPHRPAFSKHGLYTLINSFWCKVKHPVSVIGALENIFSVHKAEWRMPSRIGCIQRIDGCVKVT